MSLGEILLFAKDVIAEFFVEWARNRAWRERSATEDADVETVELYLGRLWVEERRIVAVADPNGISPVLRIDLPFEMDVQNFCAPPVKRLAVKRKI
jgi:hypothetical protein